MKNLKPNMITKLVYILSSMMFSSILFASDSEIFEIRSSYVTLSNAISNTDVNSKHHKIRDICADEKTLCVDLSQTNLDSEDFKAIVEGLIIRGEAHQQNPTTVKSLVFLNIAAPNINTSAIYEFFKQLQAGSVNNNQENIYPYIQDTIIKTGVSLTDDFIENIQDLAPNVVAHNIQLVK